MSTSDLKTVISVSDMAKMVGLSRPRFYQLVGTTFPWPLYDLKTRRPFYNEELQQICLKVRRRNCGIDGKPLMFYSRRLQTAPTTRRTPKPPPKRANGDNYSHLIDGLKSLGLVVVPAQVTMAIKEIYPNGLGEVAQGEVLRAVFLHIKRQNCADNVGQ